MNARLKEGLAEMADVIVESGMRFIAADTFHIEKSAAYMGLGSGIKSVEFVRRKNETLLFAEAKTTFPNPDKSEERFDAASGDIADKFVHSLNLYASIALGLRPDDISATDNLSDKNAAITLVLVIREHKPEWCEQVKCKLTLLLNRCAYFRKIWRPKVYVLNYDDAVKRGIAEAN
ncbi:MAG: hypothetical protein LBS62_11105 [Clostridiales bacterium]|jgi:hypothetical protein|nr:hypothetical protein [Clostridiales bacterium]